MRKQFDIKYRPQIESGEYKVETRNGIPVRIICWDAKGSNDRKDIIGLTSSILGSENLQRYNTMGHLIADSAKIGNKDLFIVTPEEELTEFEKAIKDMIKPYAAWPDDIFKEESAKLLFLAREQFIKDGYVIEKKAFHDAVEKVDPGIMKEVSKNVDMTEYEKGRAEALKDLPRWKKAERDVDAGTIDFAVFHKNDGGDHEDWFSVEATNRLYKDEYYLELSDLKKLPGFKDDKSHE